MTAPQPGQPLGRPADLPDRLRPARHRGLPYHKLVGVDLAAAKSAIESTIEYLKAEHGPQEWEQGTHPEIPAHEALNNP